MPRGRANDAQRDHGRSLRSEALGEDGCGLFVPMLAVSSQGVLPRDPAEDVRPEILAGDDAVGGSFDLNGTLCGEASAPLGHLAQVFGVEAGHACQLGESTMLRSESFDIHARHYIAHGYALVNSLLLVEKCIASRYKVGMKSIDQIRLNNLLTLLQTWKQAEIARRIERTPPQVFQWVAKARGRTDRWARNMDDESARLLESALGLPDNWMDNDHSAAEPSNLSGQDERHTRGAGDEALSRNSRIDPYTIIKRLEGRVTPRSKATLLKLEKLAIEGKLDDEAWSLLENIAERFERAVQD